MPTRTNPQDILNKLDWVKNLPGEGGSWGKGLTETAEAVALEVLDLEKQKEDIEEQIRKRLRVMRAMPGRADREAPLMFSEAEVKDAKANSPVPE